MLSQKHKLDVSILIATYNRGESLRHTLENMASLDMEGISVEFVVIDNNSSDNTKEVINSYSDQLPIRYLFEPRPGKNCALNKALDEIDLGEIVVFTDDDVKPQKNWIKTIYEVSQKQSKYSVFGGQIYAIWPDVKIPLWAENSVIQIFGFAVHNRGMKAHTYASGEYPFGPNFWVRKDVFEGGRRFNENIGPRPKKRMMGSETSFLQKLEEDGYEIYYCPDVVVGHCVTQMDVKLINILKRAYRWGKGKAHLLPMCRKELYYKHQYMWYIIRFIAIFKLLIMFCFSFLSLIFCKPNKSIYALHGLGYNIELIKIVKNKR